VVLQQQAVADAPVVGGGLAGVAVEWREVARLLELESPAHVAKPYLIGTFGPRSGHDPEPRPQHRARLQVGSRLVMRRHCVGVSIMATLALALASPAAPSVNPQCLDMTGKSALRTASILDGLGLTRDVAFQARARLSTYGSIRGFAALDGIGLTPEQITEITRRIAAQVAATTHPLGWPCKPFAHRTQTVAFVKQLLLDNGFRRASIRFTMLAARQVQFAGIQDGYQYFGIVVRSGPRQITMRLVAPIRSGATGGTYEFATKFEP
jgi:hypothetical protein